MHPPTSFRLFAALLAFCAALSSPALALAHGEAHEHERHSAVDIHSAATDHSAPIEVVAGAADDEGTPHPGLHAGSFAKVPLTVTIAPGSAPAVVPVPDARGDTGREAPAADECTPAAVRAAPPDQPRAPPLL